MFSLQKWQPRSGTTAGHHGLPGERCHRRLEYDPQERQRDPCGSGGRVWIDASMRLWRRGCNCSHTIAGCSFVWPDGPMADVTVGPRTLHPQTRTTPVEGWNVKEQEEDISHKESRCAILLCLPSLIIVLLCSTSAKPKQEKMVTTRPAFVRNIQINTPRWTEAGCQQLAIARSTSSFAFKTCPREKRRRCLAAVPVKSLRVTRRSRRSG